MSVSQPNVTAEPREIGCAGVSQVTFSFRTASELSHKPTDIVLVLDVSGSLLLEIDEVKSASKELIRVVAVSSGGSQTSFGSSTRMALVSFRDQAKLEMDLTHDAHTLRNLVDTLQADGGTDHASAFRMAGKVLSKDRSKNRKVIMFTDGEASTFAAPIAAAKKLRNDGVEIYCIGLLANTQQIYQWAIEPKEQHLAHTEDPALLRKLFREVATEIALSGVHDALLQVGLTPDFQLEGQPRHCPGHRQAEAGMADRFCGINTGAQDLHPVLWCVAHRYSGRAEALCRGCALPGPGGPRPDLRPAGALGQLPVSGATSAKTAVHFLCHPWLSGCVLCAAGGFDHATPVSEAWYPGNQQVNTQKDRLRNTLIYSPICPNGKKHCRNIDRGCGQSLELIA